MAPKASRRGLVASLHEPPVNPSALISGFPLPPILTVMVFIVLYLLDLGWWVELIYVDGQVDLTRLGIFGASRNRVACERGCLDGSELGVGG